MTPFNPRDYGPVFAPLLDVDRNRPLEMGSANQAAWTELQALSVDSAFAHTNVAERDMAACCISGVWLVHDFLDESHSLSQNISNSSGSFWHGIMHRREGDFSNAKYWFRHVGNHSIFGELVSAAQKLASAADAQDSDKLASLDEWDPFLFVDLCQASVRGRSSSTQLLRQIQQAEWELLFDHCYQRASGAA